MAFNGDDEEENMARVDQHHFAFEGQRTVVLYVVERMLLMRPCEKIDLQTAIARSLSSLYWSDTTHALEANIAEMIGHFAGSSTPKMLYEWAAEASRADILNTMHRALLWQRDVEVRTLCLWR